jgi:hypothetical protein
MLRISSSLVEFPDECNNVSGLDNVVGTFLLHSEWTQEFPDPFVDTDEVTRLELRLSE